MDQQIQVVRLMQDYIKSHINEDISIDTIAREIYRVVRIHSLGAIKATTQK